MAWGKIDDPYKRYCGDAKAGRWEYLNRLADDYGQPRAAVHAIAAMLGEEEDFDGLVAMLNDLPG